MRVIGAGRGVVCPTPSCLAVTGKLGAVSYQAQSCMPVVVAGMPRLLVPVAIVTQH